MFGRMDIKIEETKEKKITKYDLIEKNMVLERVEFFDGKPDQYYLNNSPIASFNYNFETDSLNIYIF